MSDYVADLGFSNELVSYLSDLGVALGINNFTNRDTIGVLQSATSGTLYFTNFEPDFLEYYIRIGEPMVDFIQRINGQIVEPDNVKICYVKNDDIKSYFTIESETFNVNLFDAGFNQANRDNRSGVTAATEGTLTFTYNGQQLEFLEKNYGDVEPSLQLSLETQQLTPGLGFQNTVENTEILYSSISSLGNIATEGFTVSATTGSVSGLITEQTENVTDVGGVVARGQRNDSGELVSVGGDAGTVGTTVATSGY